ncbi:MAG: hypothetical protein ABIT05_10300 [Chitinophagaceae bacterium]
MKLITSIFLFLICGALRSQGVSADTSIKGVTVGFRYTASIFPETWQVSPISASGEQIALAEIERSKSMIAKALNKYSAASLKKDLRVIYFLRSMKFYNVGYGGTNSTDALYLTNNGVSMGYNDLYLEQTFHHEYSSILYRNHPSFMDEEAWKKANIPGFDYNDPENGVGAIRNNESSQDLDTALCRKGFLTQYSLSGMENDINTYAQNLFSPSAGFWKIADQYPRVKTKVKLLVAFYNQVDPLFTEDYFKKLNH